MTDGGRRRFLSGAGLLATAAAACRARRDPYAAVKPVVPLRWNHRPGDEEQVLSTCDLCGAGCGVRVRVVDGRAVKLEGNTRSPINGGRLCARGQAALELLYHPDRVRSPLLRAGARGENRWQPLPWDDAIDRLASVLRGLRQSGEPQSLVLLDGEERGATHTLWARFLRAFGSSNHIGHGATGVGATARAVAAMTGSASLPGYDFEHASFALVIGTGLFEASPQSMGLSRAIARGRRPRLVCAWPRLPASAALVDEWLPLVTTGQVHLLLSLAHVMLREDLGDEVVVESLDADKDGRRWRERILQDYSPGHVEARTGVPASRIERLARELVAGRPSVVAVDEETADDATAAAGLLLNALIGSVDGGPGGMRLERGQAAPSWGDLAIDDIAKKGMAAGAVDGREPGRAGVEHSRILALPEAILAGKPYATRALLLHRSNPLFSKPASERWRRALAKVPFVVSFSPLLDESTWLADLVLPDHTFLERWDVVLPGRGTGVLSIQQPAVKPVRNTLQTAEVLLRLAKSFGGSVADAFPWQSYREAVESGLAGFVEGSAEVAPALASKGVWEKPLEGAAPSGRQPVAWAWFLEAIPNEARQKGTKGSDLSSFPFVLLPFRGPAYAEGGMRHLPWLAELPIGARNPWRQRVEMSPRDARSLGIVDGEEVQVESAQATVRMQAYVHPGVRPGVLALPLGGGAWPVADGPPRPLDLLEARADPRTGQWKACATRARIRRLG